MRLVDADTLSQVYVEMAKRHKFLLGEKQVWTKTEVRDAVLHILLSEAATVKDPIVVPTVQGVKITLHGKWEPDFKNSVRCTCCNNQLHWQDYEFDREKFLANPYYYCPICGAEMDGKDGE